MLSTRLILILITLISAAASFGLGLIVVLAGFRKDRRRTFFALFAFATTLWIGAGQLMPVLLTKEHYAQLVNVIGQTTINIVAIAFALFVTTYLKRPVFVRRFLIFAAVLFPIAELYLIFSKSITGVYIDPSTGFLSYEFNPSVYPFIVIYPLIVVLIPVIAILRDAKKEKKGEDRQVKRRLTRISSLYALGILVSTYIVPVYVYDNLLLEFSVFNIITIAYLYTLGRQLLKNRMVDLRRNGWRSSLRFLIKAVFLASFSLTVYLMPDVFPTKGTHTLIVRLTAGILAVFGWRLGEALADRILKRYEISLHEFNSSLQKLRTTLDKNQLSKLFADILISNLKTEKVLILFTEKSQKLTENDILTVDKAGLRNDFISTHGNSYLKVFSHILDGIGQNENLKQVNREELSELHLGEFYHGTAFKNTEASVIVLAAEKTDGEEYGSNDLAILNAAVNEFTLVVQNAQQYTRIKKFNEELEQKIENATRELRKTNEKLKALDEAKDEFISMASHQLRTPLTAVKGYVSMVLEGDAGKIPKQQKELLEQAFTSSQRMVYLIADLLNVSRLKTGKFIIESAPTSLPDMVESEIGQLVQTAKARQLELTYKKPENFPTLNLDETKTRQVIMNFIDNAIYYTPAGGHISVELSSNDKSVEFKVIDDGLGVPKSEQPHLFTKFFRAGNAKKARPDGTGLGLFMARKVIVAQEGALIFSSVEGKGSTFGFSFPRATKEVK